MAQPHAKVFSYFADAVVEAIGHQNLGIECKREAEPDEADFARMPLTAVIFLTGPKFEGHAVCALAAEVLRSTTPIKDAPKDKEDQFLREWFGEMLNLVVGQFKRKISGEGFECRMSTPFYPHYVRSTAMNLEEYGPKLYEDDGRVEEYWFRLGKFSLLFQLGAKLTA